MRDCIKLKKSNCKNCYKCIRTCPVKSILFDNNQAHIVDSDCILCGKCFVACPQNAKVVRDDITAVKSLINNGKKVIASLAPSYRAKYPGASFADIKTALLRLGFNDVVETSLGATAVKTRYEELIMEKKSSVIISSCCPTVNLLIQKYYPSALKYLAPVKSPMLAHALMIKKEVPDAFVVFIGPCISKKAESDEHPGIVDSVITYEELENFFVESNVKIEVSKKDESPLGKARLFPITGGIIASMNKLDTDYKFITVDGIQNCINAIEDILNGNIDNCFIEMSSCINSCVGGPLMGRESHTPIRDILAVKKSASSTDFTIESLDNSSISKTFSSREVCHDIPTEVEIEEILAKMGKTKKEDELNCGSCGYNSCRDKAVAIHQGRANLLMCLPFLKDKAESFSNNIVNNTPNGLMVLNEKLEIQLINKAFCSIVEVSSPRDVASWPIDRLIDPAIFTKVIQTKQDVKNKQLYLTDYKKYVDISIIYDKEYHIIMTIMRDVTKEVLSQIKKETISKSTIDITDKVIEKQMRVVQEIASLLGETTAETKIALSKLKETLKDE